MSWFYELNGQQAGPVSDSELEEWLGRGKINRHASLARRDARTGSRSSPRDRARNRNCPQFEPRSRHDLRDDHRKKRARSAGSNVSLVTKKNCHARNEERIEYRLLPDE